jgi:hypothetical protein
VFRLFEQSRRYEILLFFSSVGCTAALKAELMSAHIIFSPTRDSSAFQPSATILFFCPTTGIPDRDPTKANLGPA